MKKILLVSGCSFTTSNYISMQHPNMNCDWPKWPELLAKMMDLEIVNLAHSGSGQEYIFTSIYDYIYKNGTDHIGYVIAAWSQAKRRDYSITKYNHTMWNAEHFDLKGDLFYSIKKTLMYQGMFETLMKQKELRFKHFQMIEAFKDNFENLPSHTKHATYVDCVKLWYKSPLRKAISEQHFIGWPGIEPTGYDLQSKLTNNKTIKSLQISLEDSHPSAKGHETYAKYIYKNL